MYVRELVEDGAFTSLIDLKKNDETKRVCNWICRDYL
jgi:hypothetical protein